VNVGKRPLGFPMRFSLKKRTDGLARVVEFFEIHARGLEVDSQAGYLCCVPHLMPLLGQAS
jgi:hypothetical protein